MADESVAVAAPPAAAPEVAAPVAPSPQTAQPSVSAEAERGRDEKGRFTAAKIREAAGEPPESTPPSAPADSVDPTAPVVTAAPAVPVASSLDEDLAAIAAVDAGTPTAAAPVATSTPAPTPAPAPPTTQEAAQLHGWAANPEAAQKVVADVYQWNRLNDAINRGDMGTLVGMMAPAAQQRLVDHIYQQNKDALAQRYADEANGVGRDPRLDQALAAVAALQQQFEQRNQETQQRQQQTQQQQALLQSAQQLQNKVDGYFDAVKMKESPTRKFVEAALFRELQADPAALTAFRNGQFGHLRPAFEKVYKEWKATAAPAVASVPVAAPKPSDTLMSAPAGTGVVAPQNDLVVDGRVSGKAIVTRLKDYLTGKAS